MENLALPIALDQLKAGESCSYAAFLKAVYEDYDLEVATSLVDKLVAEANDDALLRKYALDIKYQAQLLITQMKVKLYTSVPVDEVKAVTGDNYNAAITEIETKLGAQGFTVETANGVISCTKKSSESFEQALQKQAIELFKKTELLNQQYLVQREKVERNKVK